MTNTMVEYGWLALLIAVVGDLLVSSVLALFYTGYSWRLMSISVLGNTQSPVRVVFNLWMFLEGILFLAAIPAIYHYYNHISKGLTNTMIVFIAIFAVGACIFTCFFSVNESKDVVTTAAIIHGIGSVIGFMVLLFVPLLLSILSFKSGDTFIGTIAIVSFVAALFFFVLFVMADKPEFANTAIAREGLWQRLNLLFVYLPFGFICVKNIIGNR